MIVIGTPYTKGAGYFMDGQNLNVSQRKEADVRTCTHCQVVIKMQEWKDDGAWCGKCFAPICSKCGIIAESQGCVPFMKKIEDYANSQMRYEKILRDAEPATPQPILMASR